MNKKEKEMLLKMKKFFSKEFKISKKDINFEEKFSEWLNSLPAFENLTK